MKKIELVRPRGFTLIELLVVIAIIALLLSVLVPGLKKAKDSAKKVVCMSNLNQWAKIWGVYLNDNKDTFMDGWPTSRKTQWMVVIPDYMRDYDHTIWTCPFADNPNKCVYNKDGTSSPAVHTSDPMQSLTFTSPWGYIADAQHSGYNTAAGDYGSYGLNAYVYNVPGNAAKSSIYWKKRTITGASANTVPIMGDSMWCEIWPQSSQRPVTNPNGIVWNGWGMGAASIDRHRDQKNYWMFLDFSVRPMTIKELWRLNWHRNWTSQEPDWSPYPWIK